MNTRLLSEGIWRGVKYRAISPLGQVSFGVLRSVGVQEGRHYSTAVSAYHYRTWFTMPQQWQYSALRARSIKQPSVFTGISRIMSRTTTTKQWLSSKRLFSTSRRVLNASNAAGTPASNGDSPQKMGALKRLVTVYGRLGLIAYLGVSVVDYACCYLVVRAAGAERVIVMEQWLKENLGRFSLFPSKGNNNNEEDGIAPEILDLKERVQDEAARERALAKMSNGDDATAKSTASAATLLLVAYGLHKLIMPLRVAFTALILPPMVKRFGHITWLVGKNAAKAVKKSPSPSGKL